MPIHRQEDYGERDTDQSPLTHGQHEMLLHRKAQVGMKPQQALQGKLESAGLVFVRPSMLPLRKQHGDPQLDKVGDAQFDRVGGRPARQSRETVRCNDSHREAGSRHRHLRATVTKNLAYRRRIDPWLSALCLSKRKGASPAAPRAQ
jgi:hypothetical protein